MTEYTYANTGFVEDVVREIILKLDSMENVIWYCDDTERQECIHNHNAYSCEEKSKQPGILTVENKKIIYVHTGVWPTPSPKLRMLTLRDMNSLITSSKAALITNDTT